MAMKLHESDGGMMRTWRKYRTLKKTAGYGAEKMHRIPSMCCGGMVDAPARKGKVVRLHKGELVVPARKVRSVIKAARKAGIELPIRRH